MTVKPFQLLCPRELSDALATLEKHSGNIRVLAGGTDLLPSMRQRLFEPEYVLDIRQLREIQGIRLTEQGIEIGAFTTLHAIENSDELKRSYPLLVEAAKTVASPVIRNMATIGGNVCLDTRCLWYNQSLSWRKSCGFCIKKDGNICHVAPGGTKCWAAFSADTPPALLCLQAEMEIRNASSSRRVTLEKFYTGEGDNYRRLQPDELVTHIFLPRGSALYGGAYRKLRIRGSIDYPLAAVAVALKRKNGDFEDLRIAITAVNPAPLLVAGVQSLVNRAMTRERMAEEIAELAARTAKPLTTSALTPEYRREIIRVFTKRAVLEAAAD